MCKNNKHENTISGKNEDDTSSLFEKIKDYYFGEHGVRWTAHNLIGHPLSEIFYLIGLSKWSRRVHDITIPKQHRNESEMESEMTSTQQRNNTDNKE